MAQLTNYDKVLNLLRDKGKPLQRRDFFEDLDMEDGVLGVILNRCCEKQLLAMVKYPGQPAFYAHPAWVYNGKLISEFDPIFKEWKKDQTNHGIKD